MRRLVILFLLCLTSSATNARQVRDLSEAYSRLHEFCGYTLGNFATFRVARANVEENEISITIRFHLLIDGQHRKVPATLEFGCRKPSFPVASDGFSATPGIQKMTAKDVIASEDAGGRYYRRVTWQRKYQGGGFSGTVAYVNSIFGDGEVMSIPDLYFSCPNRNGLTCYSIEVAPNFRLTRSERVSAMSIIGDVTYAP